MLDSLTKWESRSLRSTFLQALTVCRQPTPRLAAHGTTTRKFGCLTRHSWDRPDSIQTLSLWARLSPHLSDGIFRTCGDSGNRLSVVAHGLGKPMSSFKAKWIPHGVIIAIWRNRSSIGQFPNPAGTARSSLADKPGASCVYAPAGVQSIRFSLGLTAMLDSTNNGLA